MSPAFRFGATSEAYTAPCAVSGSTTMTTSASATASPVGRTDRPASSALDQDPEPSRSPTRTSWPESFRFCACAWP